MLTQQINIQMQTSCSVDDDDNDQPGEQDIDLFVSGKDNDEWE